MSVCKVAGCDRGSKMTRGMCRPCYAAWWRRHGGTPTRTVHQGTPPGSWVRQAVCADHIDPYDPHTPDLWFSSDPDEQAEAVRICREECPVDAACLMYSLEAEIPDGIYGGWLPQQRRRWQRKLRRGAA